MVTYGRGSGVGVPIGVLRSKNKTCPGLSEASPAPTTTQCRLQSAVWPLMISSQSALGSLAISAVTVSSLGPSSFVQAADVVGADDGWLEPQPAASRMVSGTTAISREGRMARAYGGPCDDNSPAQKGCAKRLSSSELLLAVDALQQRRVAVNLNVNGLAVANREYVGVLAGLAPSGHLGDGDDGVALGDELLELHRQPLLGQSPELLHDFGLAVIGPADRARTWLYPFDVVVEQTHHRVKVTSREGCVAAFHEFFVFLLGHSIPLLCIRYVGSDTVVPGVGTAVCSSGTLRPSPTCRLSTRRDRRPDRSPQIDW